MGRLRRCYGSIFSKLHELSEGAIYQIAFPTRPSPTQLVGWSATKYYRIKKYYRTKKILL
ncbi:protein of unknown function [Rhodovastum atsumiense]|nr:protein of unknown function [Rhodovastum atsumiense]